MAEGKTILNTVKFKVVVDGADAQTALGGVTKAAQNTQKASTVSLQKMASAAQSAGMAMTLGITVPLVAAGRQAIKAGMEFQQGMANIQAVTGATSEEMGKFSGLVKEMASTTPYGIGDVTKAIEDLSKAGLTTTQIIDGGLYGALTLAAAGEIELEEAANLAARALITFKNDGLSVADAANILVGAANKSTTSVGEIGSSFEMVSVVAANAGLTMKDTATALAVFAQNGMAGSDAGTSLKTMLMNLTPQSAKATKYMKELGIITKDGANQFYDANGRMKDMVGIADVMQNAFKGLNDEQRIHYMRTIFGQDAIRGATVLYKEGADGIRLMTSAIESVDARKVAETKWATLSTKIQIFRNNLDLLSSEIFTRFEPAMSAIVDGATKMVDVFRKAPKGLQNFILGFLGILAVAGPLLLIFGTIAGAIANISTLLGGMGIGSAGALAGVLGPILLVVAGVVLLISVFKKLWDDSEEFRENAKRLGGAIADLGKSIFDMFKPIVEILWNVGKGFAEGIMPHIEKLMNDILPPLTGIIQTVSDKFKDVADKLGLTSDGAERLQGAGKTLGDVLGTMAETATKPLQGLLTIIDAILTALKWIEQNSGGITSRADYYRSLAVTSQSKEATKKAVSDWSSRFTGQAMGGVNRQGTTLVGEAGPELLTVGYNGAMVTPLTGAGKARNVEQAFGGSNVFNISVEGGWDNADRIASRVADSINLILGNRGVNYVR
jgi:TP901 family phage tail tape measure protein